ncbi:GIY-YIG nuclease family protein [Vibrio sp. PNB22_3_1]
MSVYKQGRPSGQPPPKEPGEYRIVDTDTGEIKYIGETNNLQRRFDEHKRSGRFDLDKG